VWQYWIRLDKEFATPGKELPLAKLLPAKHKERSPDLQKRDASSVPTKSANRGPGNVGVVVMCTDTDGKF